MLQLLSCLFDHPLICNNNFLPNQSLGEWVPISIHSDMEAIFYAYIALFGSLLDAIERSFFMYLFEN